MKMADLVASDMSLLSILQRLNIALGFGEATVAEVCAQHNISADLFLTIDLFILDRKTDRIIEMAFEGCTISDVMILSRTISKIYFQSQI